MQTAAQHELVPVAEYLASEQSSEVRHEYLGGLVYAMAGATPRHNAIALNLASTIRTHVKGGPCRVYMSDVQVHFRIRSDEYFYYPDVVMTCDERDRNQPFLQFPKLIIEVLSESTERIDKREKFFAYSTIESLEEYVLVSQTTAELTIFRRANGWQSERFSGLETSISLASLQTAIPLSAVYEGV